METTTFCSTDITELAKAMLKVQTDLLPAVKDRENTFSHSRYATLNSVMEACRDALVKSGIWLTQYPVPVETGHMGLVSKLTHAESGQWQSSLMVMPLPKSDPQGFGSAMTYARRYVLSAMVGIVTEDDDDGIMAGADKPARKRKLPPQEPFPPAMERGSESEQPHPALAAMPRLDGVLYSLTTTQDGKTCIVATGETNSKKQILSKAGFTWSEQKRLWWRYAETA